MTPMDRLSKTLVWFVLAVSGVSGVAAQEPKIVMPGNKELPTEPIKHAGQGYVFVAHEAFEFLSEAKADSLPSGAPKVKFMDQFNIGFYHQGVGEWFLLGKTVDKRFVPQGWVDSTRCILGIESLRMPARTGIQRKALVVNTLKSAQEAAEKVEDSKKPFLEVPVRLAPTDKSATDDYFRLFRIYFVYADTDANSDTEGYALLGDAGQFNPFAEEPERTTEIKKIVGWVPKSRLQLWNTREALEWNASSAAKRRFGGKVFAESEEKTVLMNEPADGRKAEFDAMRYPIIPQRPGEQKNDPRTGKQLKIGFPTGFVNDKGQVIANQSELDELQRRLSQLKEQVATTEILFVVDTTASMGPSYKQVAAILKKLSVDLRDGARTVRVATSFYKDDDDGITKPDQVVETTTLCGVNDPEYLALLEGMEKNLRNEKNYFVGGGDPLEQMFRGIRQGISAAKFSPNSRKLVVLIADCGDKEADPAFKGKRGETEEKIADALVELDAAGKLTRAPIELFAIHVSNANDDATKAFQEQTGRIIAASRERLKTAGLDETLAGRYRQMTDPDKIYGMVLSRYQQMRENAARLEQQMARLQRGQWVNVGLADEQQQILTKENPRLLELMKSQGVQIFRTGYVRETDATSQASQVRIKCLVSKKEMENLNKILEVFSDTSVSRLRDSQDAFKLLIEAATGTANKTADKGESFQDILQRSHGLTFQSGLLQTAFGEVKFDVETVRAYQQIRRRMLRLQDANNEVEFELVSKMRKTGSGEEYEVWERGPKIPHESYKRQFKLQGDTQTYWYWVDHLEEWP